MDGSEQEYRGWCEGNGSEARVTVQVGYDGSLNRMGGGERERGCSGNGNENSQELFTAPRGSRQPSRNSEGSVNEHRQGSEQ